MYRSLFSRFVSFCLLISAVSTLGACGSSNKAPTASSATQDAAISSLITLDGSAADADGDSLSYAWTQTSGTTVTLSDPAAAQPTFTSPSLPQTLVFSLTVSDGDASSAAATITVRVWESASARIFVVPERSASLTSAPDGSEDNPFKDISDAITAAASSGADVYVAAGSYDTSGTFTMVEGVSLYGGYNATTDWSRDTSANVSILTSSGTSNTVNFASGLTSATIVDGFTIYGTEDEANVASVSFSAGGTLSHNTIYTREVGESANNSNAIGCGFTASGVVIADNTILVNAVSTEAEANIVIMLEDSCSATISGNTITGSSTGTDITNGVEMIRVSGSATAVIEDNTINAGASGGGGVGIKIQDSSTATIRRNTIDGGTSATSTGQAGGIGIHISAPEDSDTPTVVIENNLIKAGSGYAGDGALADSVGIAIITGDEATVDIVNNTIHLGTSSSGPNSHFGILNSGTGTHNIVNNYLVGNSASGSATQMALVRLDFTIPGQINLVSGPLTSFLNNAITLSTNMGVIYGVNNEGAISTYGAGVLEATLTAEGTSASGNFASDTALQSGSDYLLSAGSTLIDAGYTGSQVDVPTDDLDGKTRDATPDIGASEYGS